MRILISGASGFVGSMLTQRLEAAGHELIKLSRRAGPGSVAWAPNEGRFDAESLAPLDAVIHLAGENVAGGRWNAKRKQRIHDSRVHGTGLLIERLRAAGNLPKVWIGASAIGYFGDRGDEVMTEAEPPGEGFLADTCVAWENASDDLEGDGVRRVLLRIGIVLGRGGGALAKMLTPFKLGLGGRLGSGQQWMSWISRTDLCRIIEAALTDDRFVGPLNAVAPEPARNIDFTKSLGRALRRPTIFPVPSFGLKLLFGEMAEPLFLGSQRVVPQRLSQLGFEFGDADLEATLRKLTARGSGD